MEHERVEERLDALRDGELPALERAAVLEHVAACAACRLELRLRERLAAALFMAPEPPTPGETEAFAAKVVRRLEAREDRAWGRWLAPAFGLGLAAWLASMTPRPWPEALYLTDGAELSAWVAPPPGDLSLVVEER